MTDEPENNNFIPLGDPSFSAQGRDLPMAYKFLYITLISGYNKLGSSVFTVVANVLAKRINFTAKAVIAGLLALERAEFIRLESPGKLNKGAIKIHFLPVPQSIYEDSEEPVMDEDT